MTARGVRMRDVLAGIILLGLVTLNGLAYQLLQEYRRTNTALAALSGPAVMVTYQLLHEVRTANAVLAVLSGQAVVLTQRLAALDLAQQATQQAILTRTGFPATEGP
jgi:hypothetical protein